MSFRLLGSAAALALLAGVAQADYTLTILHTNDFHARFEPISKYVRDARPPMTPKANALAARPG